PAIRLGQHLRDGRRDTGPAGRRERAAPAEVVLYVDDDQRTAHRSLPSGTQGTQVTGIAGSPWDSFRPSHGIEIRQFLRCSGASWSGGRSGAGSPPRTYARCRARSCAFGSGVPCGTMTSSTAVPVGLCRRTAVLRPPTVALFSDRFTTGAPATSTSL